jgi:hypothetical protein
MQARRLYFGQILQWARDFHKRTKQWPSPTSGPISGTVGENWRRVDNALRLGLRGLPGDSSLARLLLEEYGVPYQKSRANLTVPKILTWADAFHEQHGRWPTTESGLLAEAPEQNWRGIDSALRYGYRGLPSGSSLAQLLAQRRGVRNLKARPRLTYRQILIWADLYRRSTGQWPTMASGALPFAPRETWSGINSSLKLGRRGLPGGDTLARLLAPGTPRPPSEVPAKAECGADSALGRCLPPAHRPVADDGIRSNSGSRGRDLGDDQSGTEGRQTGAARRNVAVPPVAPKCGAARRNRERITGVSLRR